MTENDAPNHPDQIVQPMDVLKSIPEIYQRIKPQLCQIVLDHESVIELLCLALFSGGHVLVKGTTGTAKTALLKAFSNCLDMDIARIQCTPDLMPSDIVGHHAMSHHSQDVNTVPAPIHHQIVIVDDLQRATSRTQAIFLEAMSEGQVTTHLSQQKLPEPFMLTATTPMESIDESLFQIPHSLNERFLFQVSMQAPSEISEQNITARTFEHKNEKPIVKINADTVLSIQRILKRIPVTPAVLKYATQIVRATRVTTSSESNQSFKPKGFDAYITLGASTSAIQTLVLAAKTYAAMHGRWLPDLDDVRRLAWPILRHRFIYKGDPINKRDMFENMLDRIKRPHLLTC